MAAGIPDGITRDDVVQAISDYDDGAKHKFIDSIRYDLVFDDKRYPPKAIVGLASRRLAGRTLTPDDFKGGEKSKCFRVLRELGFTVQPKPYVDLDPAPFVVGDQYTRQDVYERLNVPEDKRRGNWETGYTQWANDLFVFPTIGSAATGGYDYNNGWEGDVLRWYAKEHTRLDQKQIQWIINEAERVFIFTRPAVRNPFTFEGLGTPLSWEDSSPVLIRWKIQRDFREFIQLATEEQTPAKYFEGATRVVSVNAFERNRKARNTCVAHYGTTCIICGFDFAKTYGEIGDGYIHVHHLRNLASIGGEYEIDPIKDLRPVCPNCHAMLHVGKETLSIEALRDVLAATKGR